MFNITFSYDSSTTKNSNLLFWVTKSSLNKIKGLLKEKFDIPDIALEQIKEDREQLYSFFSTSKRIFVYGLKEDASIYEMKKNYRSVGYQLKKENLEQLEMTLPGLIEAEKEAELLISNMFVGYSQTYQFKEKTSSDQEIDITIYSEQKIDDTWIQKGILIGKYKLEMMNWVNMPSNHLTPSKWAEKIQEYAQIDSLSVQILKGEELISKGFGGILAVGSGSSNKPVLMHLHYKPKSATKHIGLVGKGVTFDTGGISIKNADNMHLMKCDMGGGALALASTLLAAELEIPIEISCLVPSVHNALGESAYNPGDVVQTYGGKTIEVINTDAEGRIILADALSFITKEKEIDILLEFATLTGSMVSALGYHAAGIFSKDNSLVDELIQHSKTNGDPLWPMPLWDDYKSALDSDVADVKNSSGPAAGAIMAAKFVEYFTNEHPHFAHFDIAGMVLQQSPFAKDRTATGYGLELIINWLRSL